MAFVTVKRSDMWLNSFRDVHIIIDGVDYAVLKNGQKKILHVPSGEHQVEAKLNWLGSKKQVLNIADGDYSFLEVRRSKYTGLINLVVLCILPLYLAYLLPYAGLYLALAPAIVLYLLYVVLYGRHKYLEIEKTTPE